MTILAYFLVQSLSLPFLSLYIVSKDLRTTMLTQTLIVCILPLLATTSPAVSPRQADHPLDGKLMACLKSKIDMNLIDDGRTRSCCGKKYANKIRESPRPEIFLGIFCQRYGNLEGFWNCCGNEGWTTWGDPKGLTPI
jgi:hypothetical protein